MSADSTLTSGVGTFSATLNTPGLQSIAATDSVTASIAGTSDVINATAVGSVPVLSPLALLLLAAILAMMGVMGSRAMS